MSFDRVRYVLCASIPVLPFLLSSAGCGTSVGKEGPRETRMVSSPTAGGGCCGSQGPRSQPASCCRGMGSDTSAELAKLSPEDRALAERQKTCPVTDAPLGSMGVPVKVTVKGRTVLLCCEGCQEKLNKNADEYLAKLDSAENK